MSDESVRSRIAGLRGEALFSHAVRVRTERLGVVRISEATDKLRLSIMPAVARAKRETGHDYKVESGSFFTRSGDVIVSVIVSIKEDNNVETI